MQHPGTFVPPRGIFVPLPAFFCRFSSNGLGAL
jgi:hypothetical protein